MSPYPGFERWFIRRLGDDSIIVPINPYPGCDAKGHSLIDPHAKAILFPLSFGPFLYGNVSTNLRTELTVAVFQFWSTDALRAKKKPERIHKALFSANVTSTKCHVLQIEPSYFVHFCAKALDPLLRELVRENFVRKDRGVLSVTLFKN